MNVIILHPTDELFYADFQKELIRTLFEEGRIMCQKVPLWIELNDFALEDKPHLTKVEIGELRTDEKEIYCMVQVTCKERVIHSKLTLVNLLHGKNFSSEEIETLKNKPARQIKVFRLGIVQDEGPHAKSISKSVWCKLK